MRAEALSQFGPQQSNLSKEVRQKAHILGWCIEWLQACFLVADDVMDASITRRGKPCWYKAPKVGVIAINDAFLLESLVFQVLSRHFRDQSYYIELVELFKQVIYQTELGQLLDLTAQPLESRVDLTRFTAEKYRKIVRMKTAYYTFYLPVASAMHVCDVVHAESFDFAQNMCLDLGEYFQIQDDFLDCFGEPEVIGKVGTDIQDSKCSWLIVQALKRANGTQKEQLQMHYGNDSDDSISIVKKIYQDLDLEMAFRAFEQQSYDMIRSRMDSIGAKDGHPDIQLPKELFERLLKKIYKRNK